ncbi:MAG: hypothetical protein A2032_01325 [Chloroflexi bacterium RBG_19FT_COMBO_49_13]|nr:MAG: hypothetical protein A2032_01325 [Chloroflexi bacterium RBG_19FT_COMBO_49_13]
MLQKLAPGAKVQANMGNMAISAWYAMGRVACWWLSHRANARIVKERELWFRANFKTGVRSAVAQAGRTSLKPQAPHDECWYAFRK